MREPHPSLDPRIRPITDAFFTVYNHYGYGLSEAVYMGALALELRDRGHAVAREVQIPIDYHGRHVCTMRVDMIVDERIIVEGKAGDRLPAYVERQLLNYLVATRLELGLILHFGPEPRYRRYINRPSNRSPATCV